MATTPSPPPSEGEVVPIATKPRSAKTADRPHTISIALSALALLVSSFSFWESHSARLISQSSNRAILQVTTADISAGDDEEHYMINLTIGNFGKTIAKNEKLRMVVVEPLVGDERSNISVKQEYEFKGLPDLPPGRLYRLNIPQSLGKGTPPKTLKWKLFGTIEYLDGATGRVLIDPWCYVYLENKSAMRVCIE